MKSFLWDGSRLYSQKRAYGESKFVVVQERHFVDVKEVESESSSVGLHP